MPSTLYVTTGALADRAKESVLPAAAMLCHADLAGLEAADVEIGAHSHTHRQLDLLSQRAVAAELARSGAMLAEAVDTASAASHIPTVTGGRLSGGSWVRRASTRHVRSANRTARCRTIRWRFPVSWSGPAPTRPRWQRGWPHPGPGSCPAGTACSLSAGASTAVLSSWSLPDRAVLVCRCPGGG